MELGNSWAFLEGFVGCFLDIFFGDVSRFLEIFPSFCGVDLFGVLGDFF